MTAGFEAQTRQLEKQKKLREDINDATKKTADAQTELNRFAWDRTGSSIEDMTGVVIERNRRGRAVLPEDLQWRLERALGRRLSFNEASGYAEKLDAKSIQAQGVVDSGIEAKLLRAVGLNKEAGALMQVSDGMRYNLNALSDSERNPFAGLQKTLVDSQAFLAKLVGLADGNGLAIRPRMGR